MLNSNSLPMLICKMEIPSRPLIKNLSHTPYFSITLTHKLKLKIKIHPPVVLNSIIAN